MNSSVLEKRSNTQFFLVCALLSAVLLSVSGFFLARMTAGDASPLTAATKDCLGRFKSHGMRAETTKEGNIEIERAGTLDLETQVYQSAVDIAMCPGFKVKTYCAGDGCEKPGLSAVLEPK